MWVIFPSSASLRLAVLAFPFFTCTMESLEQHYHKMNITKHYDMTSPIRV